MVWVFRGPGTVIEANEIVIDYTKWPFKYRDAGKIPYRNCLVRTADGLVGWAGDGALVESEDDQLG